MTTPFQTFSIQPTYGHGQAVITWALATGVAGNVYFYRSYTGVKGSWILLNPDTPATGSSGDYLDTTVVHDPLALTYYRGMVDDGGAPDTWLKGPSVTAFDTLTRKEYFLTREIMRREYQAMARPLGNGLPVLHYVPRQEGAAASNVDLETRQLLGPACADDVNAGYGTLYRGGFYEPLRTWVRIIQMGKQDGKDRADADGSDPEASLALRLLAHPRPANGHVIVFLKSDRRYVLQDPVEPFYLRGAVPVFWQATALMLDRDDVRHKLLENS